MNQPDHDFENYLREFKPRQPRALAAPPAGGVWAWQRFAAAALIFITCGSAVWFAASRDEQGFGQNSQQRVAPSKLAVAAHPYASLQRLALEDPSRFETDVSAASRNILPRFDGPDSTLRVLAKD